MSQTSYVSPTLRKLVYERAGGRCEYCLTFEEDGLTKHQVDHIIAVKHGGESVESNLALSCLLCNMRKGSDIASIDWETGSVVRLYNPRTDNWSDHFRIDKGYFVGKSPEGRSTMRLLRLNSILMIDVRRDHIDNH